MPKPQKIIDRIVEQGIVPLFYHEEYEVSRNVVHALYDAGIRVIEYTNRGANAIDNFAQLVEDRDNIWPDLILAIGTVKTEKEAKAFIKAKADCVICPGIVPQIATRAADEKILWIPGCMTTTEIMLAEACGAEIVKLFPGSLLGPGFVSAIKELFPTLKFMPTGGVEVEEKNLKGAVEIGED